MWPPQHWAAGRGARRAQAPSSHRALTSREGPGGVLVIPLEQAAGPLGLPFLAGLRLHYGCALRVACPDPTPSPSWPCAPGLAAPL